MQRSPDAAPGGPKSKSEAKKARLQSLSQALSTGQGNDAPAQPPAKKARTGNEVQSLQHVHQQQHPSGNALHQAKPRASAATPQTHTQSAHKGKRASQGSHVKQHPNSRGTDTPAAPAQPKTGRGMEASLTSAGAAGGSEGLPQLGGDARAGEPPYNALDESIARGPLARVLQARHRPSSTQPPTPGAALDALVETLLRTNPAFRGSADARASAGLRVQDRSILLDNPPGAKQAKAGAKQPPGYSKQLTSKRKAPMPATLKQGDVRYLQLLPLHDLWQRYISSQLANVLPPLIPSQHQQQRQAPRQQQQQQPPWKKQAQAVEQQQQQQQQQQRVGMSKDAQAPPSSTRNQGEDQQAPAACSEPHMRQLSPAEIAAARIHLSRCDLHGSILQVIQSPNPQLVGIMGVVAQVTTRALCLVDARDGVHVVPKRGAKFSCNLSAFWLPWAALIEGEAIR
ncbi:hypothetical protein DUNSADRAFT_6203 [Dunaliella salina]|uniref:Uncharacterized protein n=1 Tax=Dunaliella salina TaxID=3046 RepID=A0ABQ7GNT2_DUNSA|nr:hypothetical protein DUNSADRAFT_6203 [Dunaliella salina]|eukprot:KAF5836251.1 hypothetical protein DUNSADRAFT_6203 [Dunaliella salina]